MSNANDLSGRWALAAMQLVRWLRAVDPRPALTGAEASALAAVVHAGALAPSALAALEEVSRPSIARTLARLEALRAVRRTVSDTDARSVQVTATALGRRLIAQGHARRAAPLAAALDRLSADERATLRAALPVLERLLRSETGG